MKPFDLQKALAGAPVVTRDGCKVTGIAVDSSEPTFPVAGDIDTEGHAIRQNWTNNGAFITCGENKWDLFMSEEEPAPPTGIEAELCRMFTERQAFGIKKYGVTVEDNPLSLREWLHHALMESMDHCVYLLRAIKELDSN